MIFALYLFVSGFGAVRLGDYPTRQACVDAAGVAAREVTQTAQMSTAFGFCFPTSPQKD